MKLCPDCASRLRIDTPDLAAGVGYVAIELLFWAAVALVLAFLAAPRGEGEWYAGLAVFAILAWLLLRPRQLAARRAYLERARYHCESCNRIWPSE